MFKKIEVNEFMKQWRKSASVRYTARYYICKNYGIDPIACEGLDEKDIKVLITGIIDDINSTEEEIDKKYRNKRR